MLKRTLLVIMVLGLCCQCQVDAKLAARTGTIAHRAIQKILDPRNVETTQIAFQKMKETYRFFQRMKEIIKKKKEDNLQSEDPNSSDLTAFRKQIQDCLPDGKKNQQCHSPCVKDNTKYRWCYTSSEKRTSQWMPCTCTIKKAVLEYLDASRREMLMNPFTPWTNLEITMVTVASGLGALLTLCGIVAGFTYYRRNAEDPFQGNVFVPNPVYHPENE